MPQLLPQLQNRLEQVLLLIEDPSFQTLSSVDEKDLRDQAMALSQRLASTESEPLTIGLLGGTGVGKSTILNALAGSEISDASHRRPWTNHVLIYKHEEAKGLAADRLDRIPWQEHTHNNSSIGKILLCDLPDFDSIQTEHHKRVLEFLEHLDLLIWVTSPEKYADQKFHDFLAAVPKAQQNFFFVLNKLDLVFDGQPAEKGYDEIATMSEAFQKRLQQSGVLDPLVFLVSAKDGSKEQPTAPWNQFTTFKKQVFQERRIKEVMTIKASNLDVEVQSLLHLVGQRVKHLENFETVLAETTEQLQAQRASGIEEWERTLKGWTEGDFRKKMGHQRPEPVPLLGPGYGLALLMDGMKSSLRRTEDTTADLSQVFIPEAMNTVFETHLRWLEARMERQLLRQGLTALFSERTRHVLAIPERLEGFKRTLSQTLAWHLGKAQWPSFLGFRIWQGIWYLLALGVFLVAIGGDMPWKGLLETPGLKGVVHLFISSVHTLFSTKGLSALCTYIILNLFLGFRFYRRFSTLVQRIADQRVAALRASLKSAWENEVDSVADSLRVWLEEVQEQKSKIAAVTGPES